MKLLLTNETAYDTRSLRRLLLAGIKRRGVIANRYTAIVRYSRGAGYISGRATIGKPGRYHGSWMLLRLPRDPASIRTQSLSYVLDHELDHNLGLHHKAMKNSGEWEDWAKDYPLALKEVKPAKPKLPAAQVRYERVMAGLARWLAKKKRAETAIKKLRVKQRYYERAYPGGFANGGTQNDTTN